MNLPALLLIWPMLADQTTRTQGFALSDSRFTATDTLIRLGI